ncbi:hypothetical protein chiPu_0005081 [Chiloscyllium punctatum]|uniref:Plasminogen n=1 Tax=Chiloscyllium punctatum TaxID=137246 RepID=A0A401S8F4_CHIPU|nr:hypothetical protein [Chiloscyllium punctatum]
MLISTGLLFLSFLCFVRSNILTEYVKTQGAWIYSARESKYPAVNVEKCAQKCNSESQFLCRAFLFTQKNQECITTADNSHTQSVVRKPNVILYEKQAFLLECKFGNGETYRGTATKTISNRTCQRWDRNTPHIPNYTPENSPHADLEENYCRNPDNDFTGPWCYTQDVNKRWEYCLIPNCEEECMFCSGEKYRGKISQTEDGTACQRWDSQTPHLHGYSPSIFPDKYLEENYCRNPDGEPRPWCFTTDIQKRWAFCNIPRCDEEPPPVEEETNCYTGKGQKYRGTERTTVSGRICQRWDTQTPHVHSRTPENYPCKGLEHNYCRNPDNEKEPWCYTTDPDTRWEYCQARKCGLQPAVPTYEGGPTDCFTENGYDYRGTTSVTVSGRRCQEWDYPEPHNHSKTPHNYPEAGLVGNYCRNPDNDRAPWCFTTDPTVRWEYCRISKCQTAPPQSPTIIPSRAPNTQTDCQSGIGETYRGTISTTASGRTCQNWSAMTPHKHHNFTPETHPNAGLDGNYCRNPDGDLNGPWCFTTDPKKQFDYCDDIPICGTLIDINWVLTAKHCIEKNPMPSYYKVYIGIHRESASELSRQIINIDKIVIEPNRNDIALLKLQRSAVLSDKVSLICLPTKGYIVSSGAECYVTGWGDTQGTGGSGFLKEAGFPVIDNKVCNRPEYLNGRVKSSELCAGNIEGAVDSCQLNTDIKTEKPDISSPRSSQGW